MNAFISKNYKNVYFYCVFFSLLFFFLSFMYVFFPVCSLLFFSLAVAANKRNERTELFFYLHIVVAAAASSSCDLFADSSRSHASFSRLMIVWCVWIFNSLSLWIHGGNDDDQQRYWWWYWRYWCTSSGLTLKFRQETCVNIVRNVICRKIVEKMRDSRDAVGTLCALIFVNLVGIGLLRPIFTKHTIVPVNVRSVFCQSIRTRTFIRWVHRFHHAVRHGDCHR